MSDLFNHVYQRPGLYEVCRVDPYLACVVDVDGDRDRKFGLLVTDDPWNAWFVAQYQIIFSQPKVMQAGELIHGIGERPGKLFKFDHNDDNGMVRAVFQLPVAHEPRWEDDVRVAVSTLIEEWSKLLPFLDRIDAGESAADIIDEAKRSFAAIDARKVEAMSRAG